jgi:hypothetical protein
LKAFGISHLVASLFTLVFAAFMTIRISTFGGTTAPLLVAHAPSFAFSFRGRNTVRCKIDRWLSEFDFQFQKRDSTARCKIDSEFKFSIAGNGDEVALVINVLEYYRVL